MRVAALAVVLLAVLAGCNALPGGGSGGTTATVTPAPLPAASGFPPGVTESGVEDPIALSSAHRALVDDRSYTLGAERVVRYRNGTLRSRLRLRVALAADRSYLANAATAGPYAPVFLGRPPAQGVYWSNGTVYLRKFTRKNETTYNRFGTRNDGAGTWGYWVTTVPFGGGRGDPETFYREVFGSVPTRTVQRQTVDGTVVYRLEGTRAGTGGFDRDVANVTDLRLDATVTAEGLVRTMSLRYAGVTDGEPVAVHWTVTYRNVGNTTVERPAWFERAI